MKNNGKDYKTGPLTSLIYCCGQFGGNITNMVFVGWVYYFYTNSAAGHVQLISYKIMGAAVLGGRLVDAISDPVVGVWSDGTRSRLGRRRPFLMFFSPLLVLTFILLFKPPFPAGSVSLAVYTVALMGLFWFFFTAVMGPFLSLYPEIFPSTSQRVKVSIYMAVAMLLATAYQGMVASKMVDTKALNWGYFNMALFSGAIALVFLYITAFAIRERHVHQTGGAAGQSDKYTFFQALSWTFRNRPFVIYILASIFQYLGFASITAVMPFIVTRLMGQTEGFMQKLYFGMLPGFVVSFLLIKFLTNRFEKALLYKITLFLLAAFLPLMFFIGRYPLPVSPTTAGFILMVLLSLPIAGNMVLPMAILADIVDYDEKISKHRREGIYFGMQGFLQKAATGLSAVLQSVLFAKFGAEEGHFLGVSLLGPVAGVFGFIGFLVFLFYPLDEKTKDLKRKAA